jgi:hypothetical protein
VRERRRLRPAAGTCLALQPRQDPAQVVEQEVRQVVREPVADDDPQGGEVAVGSTQAMVRFSASV